MLDLRMDIHKDSLAVADMATDHHAEVVSLGTIGTRHGNCDTLIRNATVVWASQPSLGAPHEAWCVFVA
jgi:hypothetical protein